MDQQPPGETAAPPRNMRPWGSLLVVGGAVGALVWLWWGSVHRPDISFLPRRSPADWIVYATPAQASTHPRVELDCTFRCGFQLSQAPAEASLQVAGFHRYAVVLNGMELGASTKRGANWKQPDRYEVSKQLHAGQNEIVVNVFNSNGPPSLWLALDTGRESLVTSEAWEASYAGATWAPAHRASRPMLRTAGSELAGGETAWESARGCWPTLLILGLLSAGGWWVGRGKRVPGAVWFFGVMLVWLVLFANNLGVLPELYGFDAVAHMDYVRYIMEHKALPLANEGYEMFQPPLYYMLCAGILKLCHLSLPQRGAVEVLRLFGMAIGIAHFSLVWGSLRLLFPEQRAAARWGGVLAACLPVLIYLSQYITNEAFAAACASGCVFLCLWMLKRDEIFWKHYAVLGCCLGVAMLAKSTALLVLPPVLGALIWRGLQTGYRTEQRGRAMGQVIGGTFVAAAICIAICGWHYGRTWKHFGTPFIGVWDPRLGYSYWQDEGYRTAAFFLRFGAALVNPWFSGSNSFADGIYSTLWGDGLMGGTAAFVYHPPWNYRLTEVVYWLALLPTSAVVIGGVMALREFIKNPRPEWFLVLGLGFLGLLALVHMTLIVPQWCTIKAFYALCALTPFCACAGLGMSWLLARSRKAELILGTCFTLWALASVAAFWIPHGSARAVLAASKSLRGQARFAEAGALLAAKLEKEPENAEVRSLFADNLMRVGDFNGAMEQAARVLRKEPGDMNAHLVRGGILASHGHTAEALEEYRRAAEAGPGQGENWQNLTRLLLEQDRIEDATRMARDGLAADPYNGHLHYYLGAAWQARGETDAALAQMLLAARLSPEWAAPRRFLGAVRLAQGRVDEAANQYAAAVRLEPNDSSLKADFGKTLSRQGRMAEATNELNEALRLEPTNAVAHCDLASALEKLGDTYGAMFHYTEALRLEPGLSEAVTNLAQLKQRMTKPRSE